MCCVQSLDAFLQCERLWILGHDCGLQKRGVKEGGDKGHSQVVDILSKSCRTSECE
jgi:hypothetical protein